MNYSEAIEFLFGSLPMYQRVGRAAYKANLDNSTRLDAYFGHPHRQYPTIHVAGTNGKGSVSHMLASVLQEAGYKTGLYTSPHLLDFRERIRVDGNPVPREVVTGFVNSHSGIIREVSPSFFEMTVAMAFDHFAREKVEVAVIETGMGGRLDSTNIILPALSVITNISLDHMEFLGNDLVSIAREKGGIIKRGVPLVLGPMEREPRQLLLDMAAGMEAAAFQAETSFQPLFHTYDPNGNSLVRIRDTRSGETTTYQTDLAGKYQQENLVTLLAAAESLREHGWNIPGGSIHGGLGSVGVNTGIMGRWQTIGSNPRSICDMAHNRAGVSVVMEQLGQIPRKTLHVVWGMAGDKETDAMLSLLPREARYYFSRAAVPRSMDPAQLQAAAGRQGLRGNTYSSVKEAYQAAMERAKSEDMIFTGGSTFVVADLLQALGY